MLIWWHLVSHETVGQFCQNIIELKTLDEIIALLYVMYLHKCVPGRTKTGAVPWRCRDVKTKRFVTSTTQEITSPTELCSLVDLMFTLNCTKIFCFPVQNVMCQIRVIYLSEVLREMPVQGHSPRKSFSFPLCNFIYTKYLIAKWRQSHMNVSLSH